MSQAMFARGLDGLCGFAPPWWVSLLAQMAAVAALQDITITRLAGVNRTSFARVFAPDVYG